MRDRRGLAQIAKCIRMLRRATGHQQFYWPNMTGALSSAAERMGTPIPLAIALEKVGSDSGPGALWRKAMKCSCSPALHGRLRADCSSVLAT
jgi:hypothetical protein